MQEADPSAEFGQSVRSRARCVTAVARQKTATLSVGTVPIRRDRTEYPDKVSAQRKAGKGWAVEADHALPND